jgi:hypothetical protein
VSLDRWIDDLGGELRAAATRLPARRLLPTFAPAAVLAAVAVVAAGAALAALRPWAGRERTAPAPLAATPPRGPFADPATVLAQAPYLGVSCPHPNRIACDRVGLAVWVKRPATSVIAWIAGRRIALAKQLWGPHDAPRVESPFIGFLDNAGLSGSGPLAVARGRPNARWLGDPPVRATVIVEVRAPDGRPRVTRLGVPLHPGWG